MKVTHTLVRTMHLSVDRRRKGRKCIRYPWNRYMPGTVGTDGNKNNALLVGVPIYVIIELPYAFAPESAINGDSMDKLSFPTVFPGYASVPSLNPDSSGRSDGVLRRFACDDNSCNPEGNRDLGGHVVCTLGRER